MSNTLVFFSRGSFIFSSPFEAVSLRGFSEWLEEVYKNLSLTYLKPKDEPVRDLLELWLNLISGRKMDFTLQVELNENEDLLMALLKRGSLRIRRIHPSIKFTERYVYFWINVLRRILRQLTIPPEFTLKFESNYSEVLMIDDKRYYLTYPFKSASFLYQPQEYVEELLFIMHLNSKYFKMTEEQMSSQTLNSVTFRYAKKQFYDFVRLKYYNNMNKIIIEDLADVFLKSFCGPQLISQAETTFGEKFTELKRMFEHLLDPYNFTYDFSRLLNFLKRRGEEAVEYV